MGAWSSPLGKDGKQLFKESWGKTGLDAESEYYGIPVVFGGLSEEVVKEKRVIWYMGNEFELYDVGGDGNCVFRAVSLALTGNEEKHGLLREKTAEKLLATAALSPRKRRYTPA